MCTKYQMECLTLASDGNPYTLFPIQNAGVWALYKKAVSAFWTVEEVDLSADRWDELSDDEKRFLKYILAFFAASDGIVVENLAVRFMSDIEIPEVRCFYGFQIAIENIHSEMYSALIDAYISDETEKSILFNSLETIPCIKKKAEWAQRWISSGTFPERLVGFACVEGIHFSGAFCAVFWFRQRNKLPGLCFSNEVICRDEALHTEFAVLLYSLLDPQFRLTETAIHGIVRDAVSVEKEFICEAVPCAMIGMNSELMAQYIEFVGDRLLLQLGYSKLFCSTNPFGFMELISMEGKTNFFERRVSEYSRAHVRTDVRPHEQQSFCTETPF